MHQKIIFTAHNAIRWICLQLISVYRLMLSPLLGNHCRFYPSCSAYAQDAFAIHHIFKAFYLTTRRLLRCHPCNEGGFDPVPHHSTRLVE